MSNKKNIKAKKTLLKTDRKARKWSFKKIFLLVAALGLLYFGIEYLLLPTGKDLKETNPKTTAMIEARLEQAKAAGREEVKQQIWVPIDKISNNLVRAVLAGEDARFFSHNGFDTEAIKKAIEHDWKEGRFARGASTVTQQLAKNLYLSESKNPLRKLKEAIITRRLEENLSKKRILEIYLNVIEWGDGIYGAEAASKNYFGKSASQLSANDAAFLAAMIPNPRTVYNPKKNPKRVTRRQKLLLKRMRAVNLPKGW
ncbi:MAG: monofunctional biosynthetic peptidoglycan transglycosylase [Blastocatellia bacterium]|nr:monofunctional biosynthetic peptidoglycan transglycosylase [Blastocatellia bacterium]